MGLCGNGAGSSEEANASIYVANIKEGGAKAGTYLASDRHVPTPPPNTEFNSVLKYEVKMLLSPKLTPII